MIGLDTNVVLRYVLADDPDQYDLAAELFGSFDESERGFVSLVALVEMYWVMSRGYDVPRPRMVAVIKQFLDTREIVLEHEEIVRRAVHWLESGADFADAVITELGQEAGCSETVTFDRKASKRAGMRLLSS